MTSRTQNRSNIRPPLSTSSRRALPAATASEAAFEELLEHFDEFERRETISVAGSSPQPAAPEVAEADGDSDFLAGLFARRDAYLVRERFADIGEANEFFTKIVGVSFEGRQDHVAGLLPDVELTLAREPDNPYDPNAVAVRYGALQLGFLRREIAQRLAPNFDAGDSYTARVASITGGGERSTGVNIYVRRQRAPRSVAETGATVPRFASKEQLRVALIGERPLRDAQEAVLGRLARGRNTLAVLGTGRGKSLCFQLPAAETALAGAGKTLVFYPLRALANDQFEALKRRLGAFGIRILRANGSIDYDERAALEEALVHGSWDIILTTPEFASFHREAFLRAANLPRFIVVDEAHHVFESRHRPAYGELGELVRALGSPLVLALTATADAEAFRAIRSELAIDAWVIDPTVRENLLVIDARNTSDKQAYLARELDDGKAIVYCNSRAEVSKIAERLRARFGDCVAFYHAGVPAAERMGVEDLFRRGVVRVIVATSAFGEGIDLPDVSDVVLYHLNFSFTEFNQMSGRAGRDGAPARIHLLYGDQDRRINDYIIARGAPSVETLRELYRGMRGLTNNGVIRTTYEDIARTLELDMVDGATVAAAVRIFEEAELLRVGIDDDGRFIRFLNTSRKVDLTTTVRYAEGRAERDDFERFCELALSADAPTLQQIINRPIYPDRVPFEV